MNPVDVELAVVTTFGIRQHLIVPNVSWGLGIHECDLLIVTKAGFCNEIEIKVSRYDLKKDALKRHGHRSNLIRRLFFAIPEELSEYQVLVPERAGLIIVRDLPHGRYAQIDRPAKINKDARPLTQEEMVHLGRLASMRIWGLKRALRNHNYKEQIILTYDGTQNA